MTYFLIGPAADVPVTTPDVKPSVSNGFGALWSRALRDRNFVWQREREVVNERDALAQEAAPLLGPDAARAVLEEFNQRAIGLGLSERVVDIEGDPVAALAGMGPNGSKRVLAIAREAAAKDPEKWAGVDLSDEALEARATARRQAEEADEAKIIASMPYGQQILGVVAEAGASIADLRSWPFLLAGGGSGSILSIMGREALLNVTAEAVILPSRFAVAEELGKPDPNVTETLLMAAGAGAVLGGAVEGLARALHYFRGRSEVRTALPGLSRQDSDLVITAVEDALVKGSDPVQAMTRTMDDIGTARVADAEGRPLDLDEVFGEAKTRLVPERVPDAPFTVAPKTATALPADVPLPKVDTTAVAERASRYSAARAFDVDAFSALESSQRRAETFRKWIADLGGDQDGEVAGILAKADARIAEIDTELAAMKTGGKRALRDERKKVVQARAEAEGLRGRTETRDMAQVRRDLMAEDVKMRDLGPRLAAAYRKADAEKVAADWPWSPKAAERVAGWSPKVAAKVQARAVRERPAPKVASTSPVAKAFSDPASKEARVVQDTIVADFRDQIAKGEDLTVDLGDGKGPRTMSAILDDLDADEAFLARLDLCGMM